MTEAHDSANRRTRAPAWPLLAVAVACGGRGPGSPTLEQVANASYEGIYEQAVRLTDGSFEGEPFVAGAASRPTVRLLRDLVAFGDLDGDGVDEAAAVLVENSGGSGSFVYLAALALRDQRAASLDTLRLGDRVRVRSLEVRDGRVRMDLDVHAPGDPVCCPSLELRHEWVLHDGKLVRVPEAPATFRGHLVWGHETRSFEACGPGRWGWVVDDTGGDLQTVYEQLTTEPYQPLFVEVRGSWGPAPSEGFGAAYPEQLTIGELRRAVPEGPGCDEDLAGVRYLARGNEPFWRVEIRGSGIVFSRLGKSEEIVFPSVAPQGGPESRLFASSMEGPGGRRIEIAITERRCVDSMSGALFALTARVTLDGERLQGCAVEGSESP